MSLVSASEVATASRAVLCRGDEAVAISRPKKCTKPAVEEEKFSEALTDIIRRDFFPDVVKLESEIVRGGTGSTRQVEGGNTVTTCHTEQQQEKEDSLQISGNLLDDKKSLGLDQFLNKYESEDDASFKEILVKYKEAHQQKHAWLYQKEKEYAALLPPTNTLAITDGSTVSASTSEEPQRAVLDSWTYTAKNSLMYIPDAMESSALEVLEKTGKTREIVHSNTRLPGHFVKKLQQVTSSSGQAKSVAVNDKIGVDGKAECAEDSPQIKGYGFIVTPQIHPGVDASPLMTWGSIEGTPLRLDSDLTPAPGPSFKLPKESAREKVALKLADQVAKANRARKKASMGASPAILRSHLGATPSKSERLRFLSPAARKLISQRSAKYSSDKALTASYTPHTGSVSGKTPSVRATPTSRQATPHLTDNLLNLHNKHVQ